LEKNLIVYSANHTNSVRNGIKNLQAYLERHPDSLGDVAYTLGVRRERLPYRSFAVSNGTTPLEFPTASKAPSTAPDITFVFTGQGAQWATMGAQLLSDFTAVRDDIQKLDSVLSGLPHPPSWVIVGE